MAQTQMFSTFQRDNLEDPPIPDTQPWVPFRTRLDFEVAELAHEAALSQPQIDRLINLLHRSKQDSESFTLRNYKDVRNTWSAISHRLTPFTKQIIQVPYDGVDQEFTLYYWDLWDWVCDLLRDPYIGPQFTFDNQCLSKFDGNTFVRFIDEPWTADRFWEAQVSVDHAKPLAFILYADKAKLSSFGREKGYPVIARIANLPASIRNGEVVGGGRVVAWLPIVKDDPSKSGKPKFTDFKAAVWHESFKLILKCLRLKRKHGGWVECWDKLQCLFFPFVPILSADYEEQCVMSLICGVMGKFPCPICLVPHDELHSLLDTWPLRTCRDSVRLLRKARRKTTKAKQEKKLKSQSLRDVENSLNLSKLLDVFRALCFDRLHTHHEGLWGKHLWIELQKWINETGRQAATMIDEGFAAAPRWRNLNHFKRVMGISFADGTKYEDILKLIVFVAHDVLDPEVHEQGYLLLQCIRAHLDVDMFAALEVHTMDTLAAGRAALGEFSRLMDKYMSESGSELKNWNFPKHHLAVHLFDDIEAKGVTRNFNTKPNEKAHRPLKKSYQLQTNFKQVADQILRADHWSLVSAWIRYRLNDLDDYNARKEASALGGSDLDSHADDTAPDERVTPRLESTGSFHIKLGSRQRISSINAIQQAHLKDPAFHQFHIKINHFLNTIPIITRNGHVALELGADTVTEFRYLQANFESMVDFQTSKDYLRCSPMFHNAPRYDSVIIRTQDGIIFGHLIFIFMCLVGDASYPMALIHPCDVPIPNGPLKDKHLGLWRVRAQPRRKSEFVFAESIIRGALLLEDRSQPGDFFVVDSVDTDMFLHTKLHKDSHMY
ncbi:hypothetical protein DEU56DRAFT_722843 [Suillus clintonianus]|uniref:uncharacterized protein n=1 Tax=Suillus clintonianus TaxID=1904413 RepID=UPI001B883F9B|nr:uncharacterized protein DEU56DRAFT_722843 [Suillus clintonianus]KAG2157550.1 hypothetical protein DEU56DRAFT_722843 [Suillus clintonianus]